MFGEQQAPGNIWVDFQGQVDAGKAEPWLLIPLKVPQGSLSRTCLEWVTPLCPQGKDTGSQEVLE